MVNLLLVSHSKKLAEGVAEMVQQMTSSEAVKIATAAGVGDQNQELGTNAVEIMEAIEKIYSEDGILILLDLGSAILSTEMALDMLPAEMTSHIKLCPAPFVEGALVAAVQAGLGSDLDTVYRDAMNALEMKRNQITEESDDEEMEPATSPVESEGEKEKARVTLVVPNEEGLHARPAVIFVKTCASFDAAVMVRNLSRDDGPVPANSLISVLTIGARKGDQIEIVAEGSEKDAVIAALKELFERNLEPE